MSILTLTHYLSFYNKILLFFIILLLLLKYPFNFDKNKKHFSLQRNALMKWFVFLTLQKCKVNVREIE